MKQSPIIFNTEMVEAILFNQKTQTRRFTSEVVHDQDYTTIFNNKVCWNNKPCRYGQVGDVMWVKETMYQVPFKCGGVRSFKNHPLNMVNAPAAELKLLKKTPAIHMRKVDARIWLRITKISTERLQSISEKSAIAEGVKSELKGTDLQLLSGLGNWKIPRPFLEHQFGFLALWCKTYGAESWLKNPFVWVVEFEVLSTTGKPEAIA